MKSAKVQVKELIQSEIKSLTSNKENKETKGTESVDIFLKVLAKANNLEEKEVEIKGQKSLQLTEKGATAALEIWDLLKGKEVLRFHVGKIIKPKFLLFVSAPSNEFTREQFEDYIMSIFRFTSLKSIGLRGLLSKKTNSKKKIMTDLLDEIYIDPKVTCLGFTGVMHVLVFLKNLEKNKNIVKNASTEQERKTIIDYFLNVMMMRETGVKRDQVEKLLANFKQNSVLAPSEPASSSSVSGNEEIELIYMGSSASSSSTSTTSLIAPLIKHSVITEGTGRQQQEEINKKDVSSTSSRLEKLELR